MSTIEQRLRFPDLACRGIGGSVVAANDEFFAECENLIKQEEAVYRPHTFTNKGQEYDGWETRRRRNTGAPRDGRTGEGDWAIVRLGAAGVVRAVVVDTAFFAGNYPPFVSVEGCGVEGYPDPAELRDARWETVVARTEVKGDARNLFEVDLDRRFTHVRLTMYPDGGVARLRVHGEAVADPRWFDDVPTDLLALVNGGSVHSCSDWFFSPPHHMLQPGYSRFMADGWESRRRRDSGNDWAVLRLFAEGTPRVVEVDTTHYKGNSPEAVSLLGACVGGTTDVDAMLDDESSWFELLPRASLQPDTSHRFRLAGDRTVTHVKLNIFPDGGVGRLRLYGPLTADGRDAATRRWFDTLPGDQARTLLIASGLADGEAGCVASARPLDPRLPLPAAIDALLPHR